MDGHRAGDKFSARYSSFEILKQKLDLAMREGSGHLRLCVMEYFSHLLESAEVHSCYPLKQKHICGKMEANKSRLTLFLIMWHVSDRPFVGFAPVTSQYARIRYALTSYAPVQMISMHPWPVLLLLKHWRVLCNEEFSQNHAMMYAMINDTWYNHIIVYIYIYWYGLWYTYTNMFTYT